MGNKETLKEKALATQRKEIIREIEEGLPKEKNEQESIVGFSERFERDRINYWKGATFGWNVYRREVKRFLKKVSLTSHNANGKIKWDI